MPSSTPQRQFAFIVDGRLQEAPTVRHLLRFLAPVTTGDLCLGLMSRFLADPALYALPVVDADMAPVALVDRKHYIEFFSRPFSRDISAAAAFSTCSTTGNTRTRNR